MQRIADGSSVWETWLDGSEVAGVLHRIQVPRVGVLSSWEGSHSPALILTCLDFLIGAAYRNICRNYLLIYVDIEYVF